MKTSIPKINSVQNASAPFYRMVMDTPLADFYAQLTDDFATFFNLFKFINFLYVYGSVHFFFSFYSLFQPIFCTHQNVIFSTRKFILL